MTDLFGSGFVPNLARPGSHVTGFTLFEFSIGSKWLQAALARRRGRSRRSSRPISQP